MIVDIYIGNTKLDTFKDEAVELNSSIANVNDITKNTTDYTKSFTVPASKVNNQLFKHYYNANIDNTFDARTKVNGRIELGGLPFKYGKWRLLKVQVKQGKPYAYTINFFGNLVSLKDKFKEDLLSDLDFSDFTHEFNSDNVKIGLTSSLFSGNLIYNLFSKKQLYYNSISSDNVNTPTLANIAWGGGADVGVRWNDLRPSIKLIKIIEAIQNKYGVTFSNDFFGRTEFTDLFLWLNNNDVLGGAEKIINFTAGSTEYVNLTTNIASFSPIFASVNNRVFYVTSLKIIPAVGYESVPYTITTFLNGSQFSQIQKQGTFTLTQSNNETFGILNGNYNVFFNIKTEAIFSYTVEYTVTRTTVSSGTPLVSSALTTGFDTLTSEFNVALNIPNLKVIDFMKGLFQMFRLVVIADENDNVYINTLKDYYAQGKLYDLTSYIDFTSNEVERGNLLNQITFKFEPPSTLLNTQFLLNNKIAYGDEDLILKDEDGNLLDGDTLNYTLPFEQIVYERLNDLDDGEQTNIMYAGIFDDKIEPVNPTAHIFYNSNQNISAKPVAFIDDNNTKTIVNFLNIPSHTQGFDTPQYSTVFGAEFNEWNGIIINNTLYTNYHKDYINSIFNIKRRNFSFTAKNIPYRILTKLKLNDVIQIKKDFYRIDNYNFNLLNGATSFNLINSFDNNLTRFNVDRTEIILNYQEQTTSVYVTNLTSFDYDSTESWVTAVAIGNVVTFSIDENDTGIIRDATITIINSDTLQEVEVKIFQNGGVVSADNEVITTDNELITTDNG